MKLAVIPLPNSCQQFSGQFVISKDSKICCDKVLLDSADVFNILISKCIGSKLEITDDETASILFELDTNMSTEEYSISCSTQILCIRAATVQGCFYAVMSLRQLLNIDCTVNADSISMQCLNISDKPRFVHRGLMLDVVRHFFDKDEVIRLIDLMSCMKLNVLHLHLSDDQGFRLQIDKYPELNKIASRRSGTLIKFNGEDFDNNEHSGYYTKSDIASIIKFAHTKHIKVIPEIDIPGHTMAIIAAMPHLSCNSNPTEVSTKFGINTQILCGGNEQVYTVIEDILTEVMDMFDDKLIHLGGDEAPRTNWKSCQKCQKMIKDNKLKDEADLQAYMFNHLAKFINSKGWQVIGWNECLNDNLDSNIICQHWTPRMVKSTAITASHINKGRRAIISNFFNMYFDYPYSMTPLRKTYKFRPVYIGVRRKNISNVLGVEGTIWTEWIDGRAKLDFNVFPRLAALAELSWTNAKAKNYLSFCNRLHNYYPVYEAMGVGYAKGKTHIQPIISRIIGTKKFFKFNTHAELQANDKNKKSLKT